jgi:hypothetical protein
MDVEKYFKIGLRPQLPKKLEAYEQLADRHFETEKFNEFRATAWQAWTKPCGGWYSRRVHQMVVDTVRSDVPV